MSEAESRVATEVFDAYYTALQVVTGPAQEDLLFLNGLLRCHCSSFAVLAGRNGDVSAIEHRFRQKCRTSCDKPKVWGRGSEWDGRTQKGRRGEDEKSAVPSLNAVTATRVGPVLRS